MTSEGTGSTPARTIVITEGILSSFGFAPSFLRRASVRLLSARTGPEALSLAGVSDPGLLLIDYFLPLLRGDQVCRRLRASPKLQKVPVVIVGPSEPPAIQASCRRARCSLFVPTPVDFPALLSRMAEFLSLPDRGRGRIPVVLSVSYGTIVTEFLGRSRDLNEDGIRVGTVVPLRHGFYINVKFLLGEDERAIVAPGQIIRVSSTEEGEYEVGIRFLSLPREALQRLRDFLETQPR